ncbi:hypothetical protein RN001_006322 [Aquatica leii]|uniref:CCHC-type domain-containing protein n=1 Tax=Aquatica leii TaxID=1421715 RepID=A0AAN7SQ65_9COLE|nr:hypothetical protein RN001_006322 [Aquatica leii]
MSDPVEQTPEGIHETDVWVNWVCNMKKDDLVNRLRTYRLETSGGVNELKARLINFLRTGEGLSSTLTYPRSQDTSRPTSPNPLTAPAVVSATAQLCDSVRKWGIKFDGKTDPISFLERVEELQKCYSIPGATLLQALPELFKDDTLLWYRNNKQQWSNWDDFVSNFKLHFVGPRYRYHLEEAVRSRVQKDGENAGDYMNALRTLMRRHGQMSSEAQLERIYENLRSPYKLYIRRKDFTNLSELEMLARDFEAIPSQEPQRPPAVRPEQPRSANQTEICWRCGRRGHFKNQCRGRFRLFCSRCGKDGVYSRDCPCPQAGNGSGRLG